MLNIFFALFMFGMLVILCGKALFRALRHEKPLYPKEIALLVALAIGCLLALNAGVSSVFHTQLTF